MYKLSCLLLLVMLSSCSHNSDEPKNDELVDEYGKSAQASCAISPNVGDNADLSLVKNKDISSGLFDKKYDKNWLKMVYKTSGYETHKAIATTDVDVYRLQLSGRGCSYFSFLSDAPSDLDSRLSIFRGDEKQGKVLGVYLGKSDDTVSLKNKPAIVLREKTDRYTLVHEFMHHNFDFHRQGQGQQFEMELKNEFRTQRLVFNSLKRKYLSSKSEKDLNELNKSFLDLAKVYDKMMVNYFLEEVAIEDILGRMYEENSLTNVSYLSYINGGYYIRSSRDNYKEFMQDLIDKVDDSDLKYLPLIQKSLDQIKDMISKRNKEIDRAVDHAKYRTFKSDNSLNTKLAALHDHNDANGVVVASDKMPEMNQEHSVGCSHSRELEILIQELKMKRH